MWDPIEKMYDLRGAAKQPISRPPADAVVIRPARDADVAPLHDLAELDSALPLTGAVLVAVVEGRLWAAIAVADGRVIADPFKPSAGAAALLALRVAQMHVAEGNGVRVALPRWAARKARA